MAEWPTEGCGADAETDIVDGEGRRDGTMGRVEQRRCR